MPRMVKTQRSMCATAQMRDGAQNFQITQFGLSAFVWEPPAAADNGSAEERGSGRYLAHTFNFWIFPRGADDRYSRRFLSQVRMRAARLQGARILVTTASHEFSAMQKTPAESSHMCVGSHERTISLGAAMSLSCCVQQASTVPMVISPDTAGTSEHDPPLPEQRLPTAVAGELAPVFGGPGVRLQPLGPRRHRLHDRRRARRTARGAQACSRQAGARYWVRSQKGEPAGCSARTAQRRRTLWCADDKAC